MKRRKDGDDTEHHDEHEGEHHHGDDHHVHVLMVNKVHDGNHYNKADRIR